MDLLLIARVHLIYNLVDRFNRRSLILLACRMLNKLSNLTLIHRFNRCSMRVYVWVVCTFY